MIDINYDKIYHTTHYGDYKIIERLGYINNDSRLWVKIKFLSTGFEKDIRYDYIGHDIIDPYYPRIHGIACIGEGVGTRGIYKQDYDRWMNMVSRCYNLNCKDYKNYGGSGVKMSDDWLIFSNYQKDIKEIPGYRFKQQDPLNWVLDKDYLQQDVEKSKRTYSKETCVWVPKSINSKLAVNTFQEELPYLDKNGNPKKMQMCDLL